MDGKADSRYKQREDMDQLPEAPEAAEENVVLSQLPKVGESKDNPQKEARQEEKVETEAKAEPEPEAEAAKKAEAEENAALKIQSFVRGKIQSFVKSNRDRKEAEAEAEAEPEAGSLIFRASEARAKPSPAEEEFLKDYIRFILQQEIRKAQQKGFVSTLVGSLRGNEYECDPFKIGDHLKRIDTIPNDPSLDSAKSLHSNIKDAINKELHTDKNLTATQPGMSRNFSELDPLALEKKVGEIANSLVTNSEGIQAFQSIVQERAKVITDEIYIGLKGDPKTLAYAAQERLIKDAMGDVAKGRIALQSKFSSQKEGSPNPNTNEATNVNIGNAANMAAQVEMGVASAAAKDPSPPDSPEDSPALGASSTIKNSSLQGKGGTDGLDLSRSVEATTDLHGILKSFYGLIDLLVEIDGFVRLNNAKAKWQETLNAAKLMMDPEPKDFISMINDGKLRKDLIKNLKPEVPGSENSAEAVINSFDKIIREKEKSLKVIDFDKKIELKNSKTDAQIKQIDEKYKQKISNSKAIIQGLTTQKENFMKEIAGSPQMMRYQIKQDLQKDGLSEDDKADLNQKDELLKELEQAEKSRFDDIKKDPSQNQAFMNKINAILDRKSALHPQPFTADGVLREIKYEEAQKAAKTEALSTSPSPSALPVASPQLPSPSPSPSPSQSPSLSSLPSPGG